MCTSVPNTADTLARNRVLEYRGECSEASSGDIPGIPVLGATRRSDELPRWSWSRVLRDQLLPSRELRDVPGKRLLSV